MVQYDYGTGAIGALFGMFFTSVFGLLVQRNKSETAQSVAVLAEWSKLNRGLTDRLELVEKEFADYRLKMSTTFEDLRKKHTAEIDEMREKHRAEMRALREQNDELRKNNDGLQRMILQNSSSTANLIGDLSNKDGGK